MPEIHEYKPLSNEAHQKIRKNWREYVDIFGLEGNIFFEGLKEGKNRDIIEKEIQERRDLLEGFLITTNHE